MVDENNQIRKMLNKVRLLKEDFENDPNLNTNNDYQGSDNNGEKVTFDDIQTIGYYKSEGLDSDIKNGVIGAVGEFLKATGLIIKMVNILAEDGRVILQTDTVKNASINEIAKITFDTNLEHIQISINSESLSLTEDMVSLFQAIVTTYNDQQVGRDRLISATQFNTNEI